MSTQDMSMELYDEVGEVLSTLTDVNPNLPVLPLEVIIQTMEHAGIHATPSWARAEITQGPAGPPPSLSAIPPADGSSPFMRLPTELRRAIFAASLPAADVVHHPECSKIDETPIKKPTSPPKRNRISELMTLNKKICGEISEVLYEERAFVIHVHEGLRKGGVEFLKTGRQPLQYKDCAEDVRFLKFGKGDEFGFQRLKKIKVVIYPSDEINRKHTSINTYFMNLALSRMLDRPGEKKNRITRLEISFAKPESAGNKSGRNAIMMTEHYWWDSLKKAPRSDSIHNLSNIELVLRPFGILTGCHAVDIELPPYVREHHSTLSFVEDLKRSMMSKCGVMSVEDELERKIESARDAMENYVKNVVFGAGNSQYDAGKLTDADMEGPGDEFDKSPKRGLSPASRREGGDLKRRSSEFQSAGLDYSNFAMTDDENYDEQLAIKKSIQQIADQEDADYQLAVRESLFLAGMDPADLPDIADLQRLRVARASSFMLRRTTTTYSQKKNRPSHVACKNLPTFLPAAMSSLLANDQDLDSEVVVTLTAIRASAGHRTDIGMLPQSEKLSDLQSKVKVPDYETATSATSIFDNSVPFQSSIKSADTTPSGDSSMPDYAPGLMNAHAPSWRPFQGRPYSDFPTQAFKLGPTAPTFQPAWVSASYHGGNVVQTSTTPRMIGFTEDGVEMIDLTGESPPQPETGHSTPRPKGTMPGFGSVLMQSPSSALSSSVRNLQLLVDDGDQHTLFASEGKDMDLL